MKDPWPITKYVFFWLRKKKGANEKSNIFLMGVMGRLAATKTYQKAARLGSNQEEATPDSKLLKKQQTKEPYAKSKIQLKHTPRSSQGFPCLCILNLNLNMYTCYPRNALSVY